MILKSADNFVQDEAGTFTGMAVMKLRSLDDKNRILNTDYSQIFGYDITIRETTASEYFKYAQNLSGKTKYIRLKVNKTKSLLDTIASNNGYRRNICCYRLMVTDWLPYPKSRDAIASKSAGTINPPHTNLKG